MSGRTIVVVYDQDDNKHGEVSVLESAQKAARLVETLLEAGFEQERIKIYTGLEMEMQVTHRPVVALVGAGSERAQAKDAQEEDAEPQHEREPEEALPRARAELQEVGATPFVKDGVRFSSLFRPA